MAIIQYTIWNIILLLTYMAHSTTARSTSTSVLPPPTPFPRDSNFTLLGCYDEAAAISAAGTYVNTPPSSDTITIPLCLKACSTSTVPNTSEPYLYAAVENGR